MPQKQVQKDKTSPILVLLKPGKGNLCLKEFDMGIERTLCIKFADLSRIIAFLPERVVSKNEIVARLLEMADVEAVKSGEPALREIFSLVTAETLPLFHEAQGQVKLRGASLCLELKVLMECVAGLGSRTKPMWSPQKTDAAELIEDLAKNIHGTLNGLQILAVGGGDFSLNVVRHFLDTGVGCFTLTSRHEANAKRFALSNGGYFAELNTIENLLKEADIVITDIGDGNIWISVDDVKNVLKYRDNRPILLVDGGIPRDIALGVDKLDDAYVFCYDDLERMAMENIDQLGEERLFKTRIDSQVLKFFQMTGDDEIESIVEMISNFPPSNLNARLVELADDNGVLPETVKDAVSLLFKSVPLDIERHKNKKRISDERF